MIGGRIGGVGIGADLSQVSSIGSHDPGSLGGIGVPGALRAIRAPVLPIRIIDTARAVGTAILPVVIGSRIGGVGIGTESPKIFLAESNRSKGEQNE